MNRDANGLDIAVHGIERDATRLYVWGRCRADAGEIEQLEFEIPSPSLRLSAHCGLASQAVNDADQTSPGTAADCFVLSADIPAHTTSVRPIAQLADGTWLGAERQLPLPQPQQPAKVSQQNWRSTAQAAWTRIRHRDLKGFLDDMQRRLSLGNYRLAASGRNRLIESLERLDRPVLLIVDHTLGGGTNAYRRHVITRERSRGGAVLTWFFQRARGVYASDLITADTSERFVHRDSALLSTLFERGFVRHLLLNSCVSFPNPLNLVADLARMVRRHRVPATIPLHDYFCICPSFTLLDHQGVYCGVPGLNACALCMPRSQLPFLKLVPKVPLPPWRLVWGELLGTAETVVTFSQASARLLRKTYPGITAERIRVTTPAVEPLRSSDLHLPAPNGIHVGIVGQISFAKGAHIVARLAELIEARQLPIRITVFGSLEHPVRSPVLDVTGSYDRQALPYLIEQRRPSVFLLPSIWPETFSLVAQELMLLNLPIAAFDLGAPAERLADYPQAELIGEVTADAALDAVLALHQRCYGRPDRATATAGQNHGATEAGR